MRCESLVGELPVLPNSDYGESYNSPAIAIWFSDYAQNPDLFLIYRIVRKTCPKKSFGQTFASKVFELNLVLGVLIDT